jgi:hypothetical protein
MQPGRCAPIQTLNQCDPAITRISGFKMATFMNDDSYRSIVDALERALSRIEPNALIKALAHIGRSAFTGTITRDEIVIALGEHADIWPRSILPHTSETAEIIQFSQRGEP